MRGSLLLTIVGAGLLVVPAQATLLYSFENASEIGGANGWNPLTSGAVALTQSTHNPTDGTHSMEAVWGGGFQWIGITGNAGSTIRDAFIAASSVSVDVTVFGTAPQWGNMLLFINGPTTNWHQSDGQQKDFILDGKPHTYTFDVSSWTKPASSDTWFQIGLSVNGPTGANITYDFDNIRTTGAVPEPASLSALAIGAIALLRRRRK